VLSLSQEMNEYAIVLLGLRSKLELQPRDMMGKAWSSWNSDEVFPKCQELPDRWSSIIGNHMISKKYNRPSWVFFLQPHWYHANNLGFQFAEVVQTDTEANKLFILICEILEHLVYTMFRVLPMIPMTSDGFFLKSMQFAFGVDTRFFEAFKTTPWFGTVLQYVLCSVTTGTSVKGFEKVSKARLLDGSTDTGRSNPLYNFVYFQKKYTSGFWKYLMAAVSGVFSDMIDNADDNDECGITDICKAFGGLSQKDVST